MAMSIRPNCNARAASSIDCSDEAQAELTPMKGPVEPKRLGDRAGHHVDRDVGRIGGQLRHLRSNRVDQFGDDRFLLLGRQLLEPGDLPQELRGLVDARAVDHVAGQVAALGMADVDARVAQRQVEGIEAGMTAGRGRRLAHQQVRVIDAALQLRRDRAGLAIELAAGNDRAQLRVGLAALPLARIVVQLLIEALVRQLDHRAAATGEQLPVLIQVVRAWQAASHADDGDRNAGMFERGFHDLLP